MVHFFHKNNIYIYLMSKDISTIMMFLLWEITILVK